MQIPQTERMTLSLPQLKPPALNKWLGTGGIGKLNKWLHSFNDHFTYMGSDWGIEDWDKIHYVVIHLKSTTLKTWYGDQNSGKEMPKSWKEFMMWCRDLCKHPSTHGVNQVEKWIDAHQGENQSVLAFLTLVQDLESDLFKEKDMSEKAHVQITKSWLNKEIKIKLHCSGKTIETYTQLHMEATHLESIVKDQKQMETP